MTSVGAAASVYARMAYSHGEVSPVRAPLRIEDRETARQQGTQFAARGGEEQERSNARALRTAPVAVIEVPPANQERYAAPQRQALPFVPFLAQQIAQEGLPEHGIAQRQKQEAVSEAYILASDDEARILGPVRPRDLIV